MSSKELVIYEMPIVAEFISNKYLQSIIARYVARKVNKKLDRYSKRKDTENKLKKYFNK